MTLAHDLVEPSEGTLQGGADAPWVPIPIRILPSVVFLPRRFLRPGFCFRGGEVVLVVTARSFRTPISVRRRLPRLLRAAEASSHDHVGQNALFGRAAHPPWYGRRVA